MIGVFLKKRIILANNHENNSPNLHGNVDKRQRRRWRIALNSGERGDAVLNFNVKRMRDVITDRTRRLQFAIG